jgi:hypothetical protein
LHFLKEFLALPKNAFVFLNPNYFLISNEKHACQNPTAASQVAHGISATMFTGFLSRSSDKNGNW